MVVSISRCLSYSCIAKSSGNARVCQLSHIDIIIVCPLTISLTSNNINVVITASSNFVGIGGSLILFGSNVQFATIRQRAALAPNLEIFVSRQNFCNRLEALLSNLAGHFSLSYIVTVCNKIFSLIWSNSSELGNLSFLFPIIVVLVILAYFLQIHCIQRICLGIINSIADYISRTQCFNLSITVHRIGILIDQILKCCHSSLANSFRFCAIGCKGLTFKLAQRTCKTSKGIGHVLCNIGLPLTLLVHDINIVYPALAHSPVSIYIHALEFCAACRRILLQCQVNVITRSEVAIYRCTDIAIFVHHIEVIANSAGVEVQCLILIYITRSGQCYARSRGSHQSCQRKSGQSFCFHSSSSLG